MLKSLLHKAPWLALALLLAGVGSSVLAAEDDVVIQVPLRYANLPEGAVPTILCHAMMDNPDGGDSIVLGSANANLPPPEGPDAVYPSPDVSEAFVVVNIDLDNYPGAYPSDVDYVNCTLSLVEPGIEIVHSYDRCVRDGVDPLQNPLLCGPQGAEVNGIVSQRVEHAAADEGGDHE